MRDWNAMAKAQGIEIDDTTRERLEALEQRLLGLRGLIDWMEEPSLVFPMPAEAEDRP